MIKGFFLLSVVSVVLMATSAMAQTAAIKDIPTDEETTISIKKGDSAKKCEKIYEIIEGKGQIEGEPNVLVKEARASWKKACLEWKKDTKELNQENKVMALDCGKVTCAMQGNEGHVCSSEGTYKVKSKMN